MSKVAQKSATLEFSKSIRQLVTKQESFAKAVETLKDFTSDKMNELQLQMEAKQTELKEMQHNFEIEKKDLQIQTDQFIKEYKYQAALKILKDLGEESIKSTDLKNMEEELEAMRKSHSDEIDKVIKESEKKSQDALKAALKNSELTHKAETATLNATVDQQLREIKHLQSTIEQLRGEVAAQRELSRRIAEAGQKGAINQYMGKNQ